MTLTDQITDSQKGYIIDLLGQRTVDEQVIYDVMERIENPGCTRGTASEFIAILRQLPRKRTEDVKVHDEYESVPAGCYAIEDTGLKFYQVERPSRGKWAGYVFVKIQAGPNAFRLAIAESKRVLGLIAKDPRAALLRYGRELGHCGHCKLPLTNKQSRELGIGPVCRKNAGAQWGL